MNKIFYILIITLLTGCAPKHAIDPKKLSEYVSDYQPSDGRTNQLLFKLNVPKEAAYINYFGSKNAYFHLIDLRDEQKMIVIQLPERNKETVLKLTGIPYTQFENICKKENIFDRIQATFKVVIERRKTSGTERFFENRYFGINKTGDGFYVLYLNVKHKNIPTYNYCINSISY